MEKVLLVGKREGVCHHQRDTTLFCFWSRAQQDREESSTGRDFLSLADILYTDGPWSDYG